MPRIALLAALALVLAPAPAQAAAAPLVTPEIAQRLDDGFARLAGSGKGQSPGLGIAIWADRRVAYERTFGTAGPATRFRIASLTKLLTAVSIMQLVEAGCVALDGPLAAYLPDAPHGREITIRQLLQHTSGLWNYGDEAFASGRVMRPVTPAQILAWAGEHPLTAPPGTRFAYSNTGYVALGLVIERVTGLSLAAYERAHILEPARMTQTSFGAAQPQGAFDPSWLYADGDAISTAPDVARFDGALLDGTLVSPQTLALMDRQDVPIEPGRQWQGLGLRVVSSLGMHLIGHHGGLPGFAAETEIVPADGLALVVLSDRSDFLTSRANALALTTLYPALRGFGAAADVHAVPDDPALTARFRRTLDDLRSGKPDRTQFSADANAALTPEAIARDAAQLQPLGAVTAVTYLGTQAYGETTLHRFRVTFAAGPSMTWVLQLRPDGKISGIGSAG